MDEDVANGHARGGVVRLTESANAGISALSVGVEDLGPRARLVIVSPMICSNSTSATVAPLAVPPPGACSEPVATATTAPVTVPWWLFPPAPLVTPRGAEWPLEAVSYPPLSSPKVAVEGGAKESPDVFEDVIFDVVDMADNLRTG